MLVFFSSNLKDLMIYQIVIPKFLTLSTILTDFFSNFLGNRGLPSQPKNCTWAVTLFYFKTRTDKKHKREQTFNFGQNVGQREECIQLGRKLITQMHESRSLTKCESNSSS